VGTLEIKNDGNLALRGIKKGGEREEKKKPKTRQRRHLPIVLYPLY